MPSGSSIAVMAFLLAGAAWTPVRNEISTGPEACIGRAHDQIDRPSEPKLLRALRHVTGLSDEEFDHAAERLLSLEQPSQWRTWSERTRCVGKTCAGELVVQMLSALGEAGLTPLRGFEPSRTDPLFELWKESDTQQFHSWSSGTSIFDDEAEGFPTNWTADSKNGISRTDLSYFMPEGQPLAIGRQQAAFFTLRARTDIVAAVGSQLGILGRCLEWDSPFYAVKMFGSLCKRFDTLVYADEEVPGRHERLHTYTGGTRVLYLDIQKIPPWTPKDYGVIICFFVLEHVPNPQKAMDNVALMLRTGGYALIGAPFLDGVHGCPNDFYRYTPQGLRNLVERAGLQVLWVYAPGSPAIAAGEIIGVWSSYWSLKDLLSDSHTHPTNVYLLARKPWRGRNWHPASARPKIRHNRTQWT